MPPVVLEVFSDVACPWCRTGHRHLRRALADEEHGSVRVVHRAFELRPGTTRTAHRLLKVAAHLDRGDAALDALFDADPAEDPVPIAAAAAGLDEQALRAALDEGIGLPEVEADLQLGRDLEIRAVPYFVADRRVAISGAQEPPVLRRLLAAARERAAAAARSSG